jgi:hypothetical protein
MFSQPNPGERFAQGFQQGQQTARQNKLRSAMAELARNPDNVKAYEVLAEADPQAAMQYKQQRIEQAKAGLQEYQGQLEVGAKIIRQVQPKDQAGWNQALAMAQQYGVDVSQIPQAWDQGGADYAQNLSGLANALFPDKGEQEPSRMREYDIAIQRGMIPAGTTYPQWLQMVNPSMVAPVTIPENAIVEAPGGGDNLPTLSSPDQAASLPPGTRFRTPDGRVKIVPGGPTGSPPSGGFPPSGY